MVCMARSIALDVVWAATRRHVVMRIFRPFMRQPLPSCLAVARNSRLLLMESTSVSATQLSISPGMIFGISLSCIAWLPILRIGLIMILVVVNNPAVRRG
jgi:predicted transporter